MTPLVESGRHPGLRFKLECCNPSGSYKDRFAAGEVARMLRTGARACVATSSGNTGSALAAATARHGIRCVIAVNQDAPAGKLVQMQAHGATVLRIPGFVTTPSITVQVFETLSEFSARCNAPLVVSAYRYCPVGMTGVERISAELLEQAPDVEHVFVPVGGGGLYSAVARGFAGTRVKVHAVQPEGCPTLLNAFRSGGDAVEPVESTTRISGLSVPFDIDAGLALGLLRENGGLAIGVADDEVFAAQETLLRQEGVYAEPAGAAAFAGYRKAVDRGDVPADAPAVCLVTGSGFKDPASVERVAAGAPSPTIEPGELAAELSRIVSS